ncbi:MAG: nickel pincer cofactor biosynthesis protein LarB [Actinomycetia bacterium]|nr:nickel pincer cofactor biosynthesis protein LarB [Actinomycetes bacterium]
MTTQDPPSDINLDLGRGQRIGIEEAVLAEPKSTAQLTTILEHAFEAGKPILLTRLATSQFLALPSTLRADLDHDPVSGTAYFGAVAEPTSPARTAVVCAGTSDRPVAAEAERTLRFAGHAALSISDVGVAGLWRVLDRVDELAAMDVVIVVAGMDGALPTVLAGLVPGMIIAVPTSVGYGVSDGGRTALHASLASCGPGLVVVNIDNGYGAATSALRVLRLTDR